MDYRLPGSFLSMGFQARVLTWVAIPFSRDSSRPWDGARESCISCVAGRFFARWATWEAQTFQCTSVGRSDMSYSLQPSGLWASSFLCPWNSPSSTFEWAAISSSRGSSWPRDQTQVFCIAGRFFTVWATREAPKTYLMCVLVSQSVGIKHFSRYL